MCGSTAADTARAWWCGERGVGEVERGGVLEGGWANEGGGEGEGEGGGEREGGRGGGGEGGRENGICFLT